MKIEKTNFNIYLIIYSINSCLICFIGSCLFIGYSPRYIPVYLEFYAQIIRCKLISYIGPSLYMFGNILDIFISLERLSTVYRLANRITKLVEPLVNCSIFLFISFLINLPSLLIFRIRTYDEFNNDFILEPRTFTYCGQTEFFHRIYSYPLFIVYVFVMLFRDILTLIMEILVGSICIVYYRKHQNRLRRLCGSEQMNNSTSIHIQRIEEGGQKLLKMTIWMSVLSIISHLIIFFTYLFPMISSYLLNSFNNFYLISLSVFFFGLKHLSNFLLFYLFNNNFRTQITKIIS